MPLMAVIANYIAHSMFAPPDSVRRYDNDLPQTDEMPQRIALVALPFLGMYKPFGMLIAIGMGGCRVATHGAALWKAGEKREWGTLSHEAMQTALAVIAMAATMFHFTLGTAVTTGADVCAGMVRAYQHASKQEYDKALEELLQVVGGILQLAIMATGAWEIIVVSALLQALISLLQCRSELKQGRYLEATAKALLSVIRLHQAKGHWHCLQRRKVLLASEELKQFVEAIHKGREAEHLVEDPLGNLQAAAAQRKVVFSNGQNKRIDFGSHFHGYGKEVVKGANLCFRTKRVNGNEVVELDLRINHVFRAKLEGLLVRLKQMDPGQMNELLTVFHSHATGIRIEKTVFPVGSQNFGSAQRIVFEGIGSITVGGSSLYPNLHGRMLIQMDAGQSIFAMHEMLSILDLDDALRTSSQDDLMRMKLGLLFRTFFPREALPFERSESFFKLSIPELKEEMIKRVPGMQSVIDDYLDKMELREILPGRMRYAIPGLADLARAKGATALTAAVTSSNKLDAIGSVLKMGLLSSDVRFTNGIQVNGASSGYDFYTGGSDSVFTQLATQKPFESYYGSPYKFLISLDALETGTYQYFYDEFGSRETDHSYSPYLTRPGISEFLDAASLHPLNGGHEIMIKERIPPSLIQGIVAESQTYKTALLEHLYQVGLITNETIFGVPVDEFVTVASQT